MKAVTAYSMFAAGIGTVTVFPIPFFIAFHIL